MVSPIVVLPGRSRQSAVTNAILNPENQKETHRDM